MNTLINYSIKKTSLVCSILLCLINNTLFAQTLDWVNGIQGLGIELSTGLAVDTDGNVYTTGYFYGGIGFESNGSSIPLVANATGYQAYVQKIDSLGNVLWVKTFDSPGTSTNEIHGICLDNVGNIYLTGRYSGTADFDPNIGIENKTALGNYDAFVTKLDPSGNLVWVKTMNGANSSYGVGRSITVDLAYNVYIAGSFSLTVDFDPGPGNFLLSSLANSHSIYIQKLDAVGDFVWAKTMENKTSGSSSLARAIAVDVNGHVYTTGHFEGTVDFDPGTGNYPLSISSGIYIQKLDGNGNMLWTKNMGPNQGIAKGLSIVLGNDASVYTTGYFTGYVDFDPGVGTYYILGAVVNGPPGFPQPDNAYTHKLDTDGNFVWAKKVDAFVSSATAIALDVHDNVYTTGVFRDTADFDPNGGVANLMAPATSNLYIQVLDKNGNFIWATNIGDSSSTYSEDIAVDLIGNVYLGGFFNGNVDFDPSSGVDTLAPIGIQNTVIQTDLFVLKLDASTFLGTKKLEVEDLGANVYPNPSTGILKINLGNLEEVSIQLFTATGQLVYNKENITEPIHQLKFEGPVGVYFLKLYSGKKQQTYKVIKN